MTASRFAFKRLRSPQELQEAAATLRRNGFTKCDRCSAWSDDRMKADAFGSARDPRCPVCGGSPVVED